jgi:small GTP-binding protein
VNRVILLTPPGAGAIAVVRITGDKTAGFLRHHFSAPAAAEQPVHGRLMQGTTTIDDAVIVLHADGAAADLCVHGGPWVVRQVIELALRSGFEPAAKTQALEGRDEAERQMLADLPLARTELALRWLTCGPRDRSLWWLLHPPRVAIVGAANAGKSTLANQLFAQERSITADAPGTTRDWVGEMADIDGLAVFLQDTPGLRQTPDPIEAAAIAGTREQIQNADAIVLVVDGSRPPAEQRQWTDQFPHALVVRNKCDLSQISSPIDAARPHIFTVASKGDGIDALRQAIRRIFVRAWRQPCPSRRAMS